MKNTNIRKILRLVFKVLCSVGLVVFLLYHLDWNVLRQLDATVVWPIVLSVLVTLSALYVMAYRWKILVKQYLHIDAEVPVLYRFYLIGMFFNIFLPGAIGGDVLRTQRLIARYNGPVKGATVITVVERAAGIYGLMLLLSVSKKSRLLRWKSIPAPAAS